VRVINNQFLFVISQAIVVDLLGARCTVCPVEPDLRQVRYFVAVAECRSFTRAAEQVHVAQQAISQQVKSLEGALGVRLLRRTSRRVELTPAGSVFLADSRRLLSAGDRAVRRARAAARGEAGSLRVAFTMATSYQLVPLLLDALCDRHPDLKVDTREVFAGDLASQLRQGRFDLGLAPETGYSSDLRQVTLRREPMSVAVSQRHTHARRASLPLSALAEELFELWPREMAPGYFDTVVGAAKSAGFDPRLDEHAAGSTVWGNIVRGRGVGLVNASLVDQLPRGIRLVKVSRPRPTLAISAVWRRDGELPAIDRLLETARALGARDHWV
jgi:DNA-binding transcriptional LysR family regulator